MSFNFLEFPGFSTNPFEAISKNPFEAISKTTESTTKALQVIAAETTDFSKKSFGKKSRSGREADWREEDRRSDTVAVRISPSRLMKISSPRRPRSAAFIPDLAKDAFNLTKFAQPVEVAGCGSPSSKAPVGVKHS